MLTEFERRREHFEGLAGGQKPRVILVTCSDSRIDPSLLTQSQPGELFIIRNAGNIVPPEGTLGGESATLEYGVKVLKIPDIVVMGHSKCGAMSALVDPASVADLPHVGLWVRHARRVLKEAAVDHSPPAEPGELLDRVIELNVAMQVGNLRTFEFIQRAEAAGELRLHGWVYKFETGEVFALDQATGRFEPLNLEPGVGA